MDTHKQNKSRFAVLLIRERKDGTIRQNRIKNTLLAFSTLSIIIVVTILVSALTANSSNLRILNTAEYKTMVDELSDEVKDLEKQNFELSTKLSLLSQTVATQAAFQEAMEEEQMEMSMPSAFPLGSFGASTMQVEEDDQLTLIFTASEGNTIIAVGAGIVESIEPDERYGNRLVIDHGNGYKSVYLNRGRPFVRAGEELGRKYILFVVAGDNKELGFQVLKEDIQIDPMEVMVIAG